MYLQKYYNEYAGLSSLKKKLTTPQKFEESKKKALGISEQREEDFEELSPMGYTISDSLGFFRTFLVRSITC